jgi:hypothetical protein
MRSLATTLGALACVAVAGTGAMEAASGIGSLDGAAAGVEVEAGASTVAAAGLRMAAALRKAHRHATAIGHSREQKAEAAARVTARKAHKKQSQLSEKDNDEDEDEEEDAAGLMTGASVPPPNLEPALTFSSRYLPEFILAKNSTAEDYYDYVVTAKLEPGATCDDKEVESFAKFSNADICGAQLKREGTKSAVPLRTKNLAYMAELEWMPRMSRTCSFRMGSDFRNGGGILSDNVDVFARPMQDLRWGGDWSNTGVINARQLFFSANQWHKVTFVGISKCCDAPMSIQMDCGDGWEDVTIANLKRWQIEGWGTDHLYMSLNRGHGKAAHSVIETGALNYGDQQAGWHMWESGHDETHFYRPIEFGTWFPFTPQVEVYIRRLDVPDKSPTRAYARVLRTTSEGFVLDIATARTSALYQVGISWIAYTPDALRGTRGTTDCYIGQQGVDSWTLDVPPTEQTIVERKAGGGGGGGDDDDEEEVRGDDEGEQFPKRVFSVTKKFASPLQRAAHDSVLGFNLIDSPTPGTVAVDTEIRALDKGSYDLTVTSAHGVPVNALRTCVVAFTARERPMVTGELALSGNTVSSWSLDAGSGLREHRVWVSLEKHKLPDRPDVLVTVSGLDIEGGVRFDAEVTRVHRGGFELRTTTWGGSLLHGIRVRWLATVPGRRFRLDGDSSDGTHKCTCADAKENAAQDALLKAGKITAKTCECLEDVHGDRSPVYQNFEAGFGGALEFMKGSPTQKPLFYAMKRRGKKTNKDVIPLYLYVNSRHEDRLYTTKWFKPTRTWRGGSIAMYVLRRKVPGAVPMFRFFDPARSRHRYTLDTGFFERQNKLWTMKKGEKLRKRGAYRYEGIQAYVFPASE